MWILIIAAALAVWAVLIHNELVQLRVMTEGAWADLQAQLKRRQEGAADRAGTILAGDRAGEVRSGEEVSAAAGLPTEEVPRAAERAANADQAVQDAARYYNTLVRDYNTKLVLLPDRFVAKAGKFQPKVLFEPDAPT